MRFLLLSLLALILIAVRPAGAASCEETTTAALRAVVEVACPCAAAVHAAAYRRCARTAIRAAVRAGNLPRGCGVTVRGCAMRSTCGRPGAVTCCDGDAGRCRIRRSAAACAEHGGIAGACASCCAGCEGTCLTTTTSSVPTTTTTLVPPVPCAGGSSFPTCGGVCDDGAVCVPVALSGSISQDLCLCVGAATHCGTFVPGIGSVPGFCSAGSVCGAFSAFGTVESFCLGTSTTTTISGTTTTTTLPAGAPCGAGSVGAGRTCGGECPPAQQCQAVNVFGPGIGGDFTFCQCVASDSTCFHVGGSCPGACPTGKQCAVYADGSGGGECSCQ